MDIIFTIRKENNNYNIEIENKELFYSLLSDEFIEVINKMFNINNDLNIQGLDKLTKKGKIFREEVLNKLQYYNIIKTDLFIYIYQWFTSLPLYHLDEVLDDINGIKREEICSKNLIIINDKKKPIKVTTRAGGRHQPYLDFKKCLQEYYETGEMTFIDLINNGVSIKEKINKEKDEVLLEYKKEESDCNKVNNKVSKNNYTIKELEELKYMPYKQYLQTEHWKNIKKQALLRAKYKCQLCSNKINLNVHHNTYENRGCEKDEDLIVLCEDCHKKFHDIK